MFATNQSCKTYLFDFLRLTKQLKSAVLSNDEVFGAMKDLNRAIYMGKVEIISELISLQKANRYEGQIGFRDVNEAKKWSLEYESIRLSAARQSTSKAGPQ